jgi:hypothetical protein
MRPDVEFKFKMAKVIARAWNNPEFKALLLSNPHQALESAGISFNPRTKIHVHEDSSSDYHLVLPERPSPDVSAQEMDEVARMVLAQSWDPTTTPGQ